MCIRDSNKIRQYYIIMYSAAFFLSTLGNCYKNMAFGLEMYKKLLVFGLEMNKKYAVFGLEMKIKLYLCT